MFKSHNGSIFKASDTLLSTVKLPIAIDGKWYETCLFTANGESEVLNRYETISEAASYHIKYEREFGLRRA